MRSIQFSVSFSIKYIETVSFHEQMQYFKGVNCNLPHSKDFASFLCIERGVLGCHTDIILINMYKAQKVSAEGHSYPLQGA